MREVPPDIHGTTSSETKLRRKENGGVLLSVLTETLEQLEVCWIQRQQNGFILTVI